MISRSRLIDIFNQLHLNASDGDILIRVHTAAHKPEEAVELAKLLNISDLQLSYITNVDAGHGLIKVGSSLVPFANEFPKNTKLYQLMTTKLSEALDTAAGVQSANNVAPKTLKSANPAISSEEDVLNMIRRVSTSNPEFGEKMKKYLSE